MMAVSRVFLVKAEETQGTTHQYVTPTAKPSAGSTKVAGKSIRAPAKGRTETISARLRMTAVTTSADRVYAITQPAEPEMLISSPVLVQIPIPTVPENAIPADRIRIGQKLSTRQGNTGKLWSLQHPIKVLMTEGMLGDKLPRILMVEFALFGLIDTPFNARKCIKLLPIG
jgi:hypothetical protein